MKSWWGMNGTSVRKLLMLGALAVGWLVIALATVG